LSKLLNIPPAQIATMGDMPNDVLMFRKSGFSIAMGNASDEVKAQANAVTDSNENAAVGRRMTRMTGIRRCGPATDADASSGAHDAT
jgi:hydroxymethylpyrimidine pyrophosphatase-like HAD family hydrolase